MLETIAGAAFAGICGVVIAFQLALALGAPWGAYTMGGANPGRLPAPMRLAAGAQALVLAGLALFVASDAGLVAPDLAQGIPWLVWLAVAFSTVSVVLNTITRSAVERRLWLPVALIMLASSLAVALT